MIGDENNPEATPPIDLKTTQKIKLGGLVVYEKKDPFYNSEVLGIPLWGIGAVIGGIWVVKQLMKD